MKLSDNRFKSDSVACVVSLRDLVEFDDIDIPDVQRGLVWNPTQIANLWKSIFAGYPIGALTLYKQGEKWQLIDGQQRWHAIKLGLLKPEDIKEAMATLWVNADSLELMVCTRRHPWGFVWKENKLKKLSHENMIARWKKMMQTDDISFSIPDMEKASGYWEKEGWVPLYRILAGERDSEPEQVWKNTEVWRKRVSADSLPLIRFSLATQDADTAQDADTGKSRIHELFTRINKGGTEISAEDYTYSTLCSYMGSTFKTDINTIAEDFLPPSRVARIYARLAYAAEKSETLKEPDSPSFWQEHKYVGSFIEAIGKAKELLKDEDVKIPASIYLSATSDEWLTVMCWCMWKFPELTGSPTDKKLLCMLPYVVCRGPEFHKAFCRKFHEVLRECDNPGGILHLVAIGTAYAACYSQVTGMYPLREPVNVEVRSSYDYDDEWLMACLNEDNKGVLHFIQSSYMNELLHRECGFYPHEKATWGDDMNRPWDEDHIVPKSLWWRLDPEEQFFQECLANKQMLYYRHNRSKSNAFIGVPEDASKNPQEDFCYPEAGLGTVELHAPRPGRLHHGCLQSNEKPYLNALKGYKRVVNQRFGAMVQKLWSELNLSELVRKINDLPGDCVPRCLQLAVERWNILKDMKDKVWCAIRHDESRQQEIAVKDFYHSLCSWLAVGKVENGAFHCFCWHQVDARTLNIKGGKRRLPDMTQAEWLKGAEKEGSRSAWWVEDDLFKDRIYVHELGSGLKAEVDGLKAVVDSVKPHSGE